MSHGPDDQGPDVQGPDGLDNGSAYRPGDGTDDGPDADTDVDSDSDVDSGTGVDTDVDADSGTDAEAGTGAGTGTGAGAGFAPDELALRRLLHEAVHDVQPREGALEQLRREVPARRARKRQAAVGMAAAALFIGTAIPALVHVSRSTGPGADPSVAGSASQAQGGAGQDKHPAGGQSATVGSAEQGRDEDEADRADQGEGKTSAPGGGPVAGADPSTSSGTGTADCTAGQLGSAVASSAAPDSTGVVYGSFRVSNVSSGGCTVAGPGSVGVSAQGAADPTRIGTARHAAGDPATGLPDPSLEAARLLLEPGAAYEVKFAWVPSETCPTTGGGSDGGTGAPSPDPTPTETATGGTDTADTTGTTAQLVADTPADGSVAVTYTARTDADAATATVANACAGTVYWTGLLPGS